MRRARVLAAATLLAALPAAPSLAAPLPPSPACAADAIAQARKLLAFHFGEDSRISIDDTAKPLPSIANPANKRQRFDVLEVWGFIYKGQYRMRFEYFRMQHDGCLLMGQEILEYASP